MTVYELPDGRLVVPKRAEGDGVLGDGMAAVAPGDPEHDRWREWLARTGTQPERIDSWPPEEADD